jgi:methyl-accepting chemotaxis protein
MLLMSLLLLISLAVVCGASYLSSSTLLSASLDKEAELAAGSLSTRIDSFFQEKIAIVETVSEMISADNNFDQDLKLIQTAQTKNPEFETFFFSYDLSGTKVINFRGEETNPSDRPHFQEASKGEGKIIVSEPVVSQRTGNNIVTIIYPLMKDNRQYGYVGSTIPINEIQKEVSEEVFGVTGHAFLVSKSGTYIWHPNEELILKGTILDSPIEELQTAYTTIQEGGRGLISYTENGTAQFASYAPTSLGWGVFITAPEEELNAPVHELFVKLMLISVVVLLAGFAVAYLLAVGIVKPIQRLNKVVNVVAQGNLTETVSVAGKDEIAVLSRDFNQTVSHLKELIEGVSHSSDEVLRFTQEVSDGINHATNTVEQIGASIAQIAKGAQAQAVSSQDVALSMSDMASGIVKIAETSSQVSEAAQESTVQAEQGATAVEKAVHQMNSISEATVNAATVIERLNGRSQEIGGILDTISQLTGQINLLALNASIEAARAGEHGRGFAVVAGEVKNLAHQSEAATVKIAQLIEEIQHDTKNAVEVMAVGREDTQEGIRIIEEVRGIFDRILESSRNVAAHILEVSAASEQLSAGTQEVSAAVDEMHSIAKHSSEGADQVVEATADQLATIQEIVGSVGHLKGVVEELQQRVGKFKL